MNVQQRELHLLTCDKLKSICKIFQDKTNKTIKIFGFN